MSYYLSYQMQQQGFQISTWENPGFPIHGQVVSRTQEIYACMFILTINIIETPCLDMNIVFNKMSSLHLII